MYKTACEQSPNKLKIDQWINEGKSNSWIGRQLESLNDKISDRSIAKYREYRENRVRAELEKDPIYKSQLDATNQTLIDEVTKIKHVNIVQHISNTIEHCAKLLSTAEMDDIRVKNVQDIRYLQMSLLESIKVYGDVMLKAQAYGKIEEDPSLLRPSININAKSIIIDMLKGVDSEDVRSKLIDTLRAGVGQFDQGGLSGDIMPSRSSELDREQEDTEGETVLICGKRLPVTTI
jgi:hypothetical protein